MGLFKDKKLLVIAPHPDDEVLGCGGLIDRVVNDGGSVYVLIATVGYAKQYGSVSSPRLRLEETRQVMELLGVKDYEICLKDDEHHLRLDVMPQKQLIDLIESGSKCSLDKIKPDIVAIPFAGYHQDHKAIFSAAFTACRPKPISLKVTPNTIITYEDSMSNWSENIFIPNFYVDITNSLDLKCQALSLYRSQQKLQDKEGLHFNSIETIKALAKKRGREVAVEAAEAFMLRRSLL